MIYDLNQILSGPLTARERLYVLIASGMCIYELNRLEDLYKRLERLSNNECLNIISSFSSHEKDLARVLTDLNRIDLVATKPHKDFI